MDPDNLFYRVVGDHNGIWGLSGAGNLFQPGTLAGAVSSYELNGDRSWYAKDMNNLAPSVGLAWQPSIENKLWKTMFGEPGKTVLRAGFSTSYTREGANNWIQIANGNPGSQSNINATATTAAIATGPTGGPGSGLYTAGSLALSTFSVPNVRQRFTSFGGTFTSDPQEGDAAQAFNPDLQVPTVYSWQFSIQREITPNMVFEVRYVGNHGSGLWRRVNMNEVNIFENGFLNEFMLARNNLAICSAAATSAACTAAQVAAGVPAANRSINSMANWGLPGQVALPIITGALTGTVNTGLPAAGFCASAANRTISQCNAGFSGNVGFLNSGAAGAFANTLNSLAGWTNLTGGINTANALLNQATGQPFPVNFWMANPHARGGAFLLTNDSHSTYNGLQMEFRRRQAKGLQFNGSYTFSKSLTNHFVDSSTNSLNWDTLRDLKRMKGPSPWDLRHAFKLQLIYEFPFGPGRKWSSSVGWFNRVIEGWDFSSITRWQSGRVFRFGAGAGTTWGTVNANDPGVELIGMTANQLQSMLEARKVPGNPGQVFYFPASLIASDGTTNQSFIKPCSTPGRLCQRLFLYGPDFFRVDWSIIKKIKITEKTNIEFRAEFLNAFNNINFYFGADAGTQVAATTAASTTFARITNAYQDVSTTDDPGGRLIQMVLRINF